MYRPGKCEKVIYSSVVESLDELRLCWFECCSALFDCCEDRFHLHYCILTPFDYFEGVLMFDRSEVGGAFNQLEKICEDERAFCSDCVGVAVSFCSVS